MRGEKKSKSYIKKYVIPQLHSDANVAVCGKRVLESLIDAIDQMSEIDAHVSIDQILIRGASISLMILIDGVVGRHQCLNVQVVGLRTRLSFTPRPHISLYSLFQLISIV